MKINIYNLFYVSTFFTSVFSHIEMRNPVPRRSKYSEYYLSSGLADYNIMAPINAGYSFPCKGFPKGPSTTTINGNTVNIQLEGSATHGGGHCQFGITTDNNNFVVLSTVIRNCLISGMSYSFDLPNDFPETDITVFWTWVNAIGNREYYMDCADVTIKNGNSNSQAQVAGVDLLVLNLPGYTTIPEFQNPGMYDGSELFDTRQQKSITVIAQETNSSTTSTTSTTSATSTTSTQEPTSASTQEPTSASATSTQEPTSASTTSATSTQEPTSASTTSATNVMSTSVTNVMSTSTTSASTQEPTPRTKTRKRKTKTVYTNPKGTPKIENKNTILYKSENLTIIKLTEKDCEDNEQ